MGLASAISSCQVKLLCTSKCNVFTDTCTTRLKLCSLAGNNHWTSLVIIGHQLSSLVIIGHHLSSFVITGHHLSSLVFIGHHLSLLVFIGHHLSLQAIKIQNDQLLYWHLFSSVTVHSHFPALTIVIFNQACYLIATC